MSGAANDKSPLITTTCLTGICLLSLDFLIYGASFIYVLRNANFSIRKFGKIPLLIICFPNLYYFMGVFGRVFTYLNHADDESCLLYDHQTAIGCITMGFKIVNSLLINMFMLRVFAVAAILKCETKEEEIK